ncbi:far upstream element-binding protein [Tanacetum coccineum]
MEGEGSSEQDERDLKRKAEDEERERKGKAKIEESDDVPAAPTPEIRSFIDNDHHYLKIIGQHAVGPSSVEGVTRELSRVRSKDVHNILGNQDVRLKRIYSASGATIGIFTDTQARFHRHVYLELLGTVDQVKIAELLVTDAITENYDASSVPTAIMPLDICHKAMNMPFLKVVSLLGMDGTNLARIEAESGTWIELDTSVPPMDGQAWERTVSIYGSEQQVKNAIEMIDAIVSEGPVLPANEEGLRIEEIGYNEEGGKEDFAAWEDEMEAYYEKHGWEKIREMDFEKGGSGEETAHKDSADTKNKEVEGKKSVKEGEQKERTESGSGTQKNDEESEDKKSVTEDEQMECAESGSGTQKNVEESEDKKSVKEDEQMECVDTGSGAQKEC